ncbi:acyltransferase [Pusillimonas sp. NJUB218]|uniref:acyltransferase family protein n=1 Tax=Pusillimonas sp. NJUB218 TaxID=2023230 RepID=UPI000F4BCC6A|nr:acyltransferase [Pusillimonas sp. NJUB218]ROT44761.1 hypothetical protein CHR62_10000 [Pusillimonas sp. NJUB218]
MQTLVSIQYLRAVAAMMVVLTHLHPQWTRMGYEGPWPFWLIGGVDIFFVISGFIMAQTTREQSQTPGQFYIRRVVRIVPLYWLLTSVVASVLLLKPNLLQSTRFDAWHVVSSYLFIPSDNPGTGRIEPLLIPGWTLNYEMFFYLLFGAALLLPSRSRVAAITMAIGALVLFGTLVSTNSPIVNFYTSSIMLEFVFGIWLSQAHNAGKLRLPIPWAWAAVALGLALLPLFAFIISPLPRALTMGLPALLIVCGALALEQQDVIPKSKSWLVLGNISYSLYLSHPIVLSAASQLWRKAGLNEPNGLFGKADILVFSGVAIALTIAVALATFLYIEQPMTKKLKRLAYDLPNKTPVLR